MFMWKVNFGVKAFECWVAFPSAEPRIHSCQEIIPAWAHDSLGIKTPTNSYWQLLLLIPDSSAPSKHAMGKLISFKPCAIARFYHVSRTTVLFRCLSQCLIGPRKQASGSEIALRSNHQLMSVFRLILTWNLYVIYFHKLSCYSLESILNLKGIKYGG